MRKYQGVFILYPPANEAELETKLENIRGEITKLGGAPEAFLRMGRNAFARPLKKKDSGFYALIAFTLDPARLTALRERLKLNEDVLRAQLILAPPPVREKAKAETEKKATAAT